MSQFITSSCVDSRRLVVQVGKDRYSARMNTPRHSRHKMEFVPLLSTHRIGKRIEAVTVLRPSLRPDLVHVYNRIPLGPTPFVVGFESHMPRYWWSNTDLAARMLRRLLIDDRCRAIVASSHAAARIFQHQHAEAPDLELLKAKLAVFYPNIELPSIEASERRGRDERLQIVFIGAHFGRKGGPVAVRLAQLARERGLPIHVTVVSKLEVGHKVWSDPKRPGFFDRYIGLLDAPNVTYLPGLPNAAVLELLGSMDFSLLTTFSDTFGWSVMESMANGAAPIVTPQGALGEFVFDGVNGLVIPLPLDALREWTHIHDDTGSARFEKTYADEVDRMAGETLAKLTPLIGDDAALGRLRAATRETAEAIFCSKTASPLWDALYSDSLGPGRGAGGLARIRVHTASLRISPDGAAANVAQA